MEEWFNPVHQTHPKTGVLSAAMTEPQTAIIMVMVAALAALATDSTVRRDRYVLPTVATVVRTDATTRQFFSRLNYDA